jgi:hypothetical protein
MNIIEVSKRYKITVPSDKYSKLEKINLFKLLMEFSLDDCIINSEDNSIEFNLKPEDTGMMLKYNYTDVYEYIKKAISD